MGFHYILNPPRRIPGSCILISSLPGSACQYAFSKPCLVNLISKDTHLVFSMSTLSRKMSPPEYSSTVVPVHLISGVPVWRNWHKERTAKSSLSNILSILILDFSLFYFVI